MARPVQRKPVSKAPAKKISKSLPLPKTPQPVPLSVREQFIKQLSKEIDPDWYLNYYGILVPPKTENTRVLAVRHYLDLGVRFSFSPSRAFDEVHYRSANPDVEEQVLTGGMTCGFEHYLNFGKSERRKSQTIQELTRWRATHPMYSDVARAVRPQFDVAWYLRTYAEVAEAIKQGIQGSALLHYLTDGIQLGYSPNASFDETWYLTAYPDVANAVKDGSLPSGFFHYMEAGRHEGRLPKADTQRELEAKYPGLTRPVGLDTLMHIEAKIAPIKVSYSRKGAKRLNVLVPTLDKNIMFGGYIALLNFLVLMLDRGWPIRLLIVEDGAVNAALSKLQFSKDPVVTRLLNEAEIVNLTGTERSLSITAEDRFLAYSMWMAHKAHQLAQMTGRRFIFFLQEFEPIFHAHDSWHALGGSAYLKPHFAIFNSQLLRNFFKGRRYGVYTQSASLGDASSAVFEHALSVKGPLTTVDLEHGRQKRFLFYARPEAHAARNLFEIGVIALRRAIAAKVFGPEWHFDGVGTLGCRDKVELGNGRFLQLMPKLELADYGKALRGYDLGLSLMNAPHPSVVPFEMAASGLVVVTNIFDNRDAQTLQAISGNIVPSALSIEDLTEALRTAQSKTSNLKARVANANRPWVTSWQDSFSKSFLAAVEKELQ